MTAMVCGPKPRSLVVRKLAFALCLLAASFLGYQWLPPSPERVLADFYEGNGRAEDMLMDPLILHAERVAPLVIREIANPEMPRRRYAIGFLGQAGRREALPTLRQLLADPREEDYYRADALQAIHMIDPAEGGRLVLDYLSATNFLGHVAKGLREGSLIPPRRTYWQAFRGDHE